jgi:histidinol dehydrogenase
MSLRRRFCDGVLYELTNSSAATRINLDALTEQLPRCITASVYAATVAQVQQLVDELDAETCLAWANEIAPDHVPRFERWAHPERPA